MAYHSEHIDLKDDRQVIAALKSGDEFIFDRIYRLYFKALCAFSLQYVHEREEAEEIVQDTMLWLWEKRETLIEDFQLKSLLFTIVRNKALNSVSHVEIKRKVYAELAERYKDEFENPDFYLESVIFQKYEEALKKLPDEFRKAFELNRNQNLTHREIADMLGVSPQTVNYRICQALKLLRVALKDYLPFLIILLRNP